MRTVHLVCEANGISLGDSIQVAETGWKRMRGLLGRPSLAPGEGLWIRPSSGVHTVGMAFAIDVVGLDRHGKVMKLWHRLAPYRVTSVSLGMNSVVELPSGVIQASGLAVGDIVSTAPVTPREPR